MDDLSTDGWLNSDGCGPVAILHGLFENDTFRHGIITALPQRRSSHSLVPTAISFNRHAEYDKLAQLLRTHIDIPMLKKAMTAFNGHGGLVH